MNKFTKMLHDVRHNGQQYFKGEIRVLDDQQRGLFIASGWAVDAADQNAQANNLDLSPKELTIHNSKHDTRATTKL